jgi:hypothetical protein
MSDDEATSGTKKGTGSRAVLCPFAPETPEYCGDWCGLYVAQRGGGGCAIRVLAQMGLRQMRQPRRR